MFPFRSQSRGLRLMAGGTVASAVLSVSVALAHDFWVVPISFSVAIGEPLAIRGQTGTRFPRSESAVAPERVLEASLIGAKEAERLTDFSVIEKSLLIRHRPTTAGQRVVAVALTPTVRRVSATGLKRYLGLEGAPELAERYEREGVFAKFDSTSQRSQKFAKSVVEVGQGGPRAFARTAGHALELVPVKDPATVRAGEVFEVRLLFRGKPLASAYLRAGIAGSDSGVEASSNRADTTLVTGPDGIARLPLRADGVWNVRALHAAAIEGSGEPAWEVDFATLVFRAEPSGGQQRSSDSSEVAGVVGAYHSAEAAGDSLAMLALLDEDAVILESGGIETKADFRAHHIAADIAFMRTVQVERSPIRVWTRGDAAWATSTSTVQGNVNGRAVNSAGAELMVLARRPTGWKITAIHWSSRQRRTP